ncbi:MAG TPA: hypothetical protein VIV57_12410 [Anaeromyxobacter sp.]
MTSSKAPVLAAVLALACGGSSGSGEKEAPPPDRAVTVRSDVTWWQADGTKVMGAPGFQGTTVASVLVPDATGYRTISGTTNGDGSRSFAAVPAGTFFVQMDLRADGGAVWLYETSSSDVDLGWDRQGRIGHLYATGATPVHLDLTGLDSWDTTWDYADVFSAGIGAYSLLFGSAMGNAPAPGATTATQTVDWSTLWNTGLPDGTAGDVTCVTQMKRQSLPVAGLGYYRSAYRNACSSSITITSNATLAASLAAVPQTGSVTLDVRPSAFGALLHDLHPSATADAMQIDLRAATPTIDFPAPFGATPSMLTLWFALPAPDAVEGPLAHGQYLGPSWKEYMNVRYFAQAALSADGVASPVAYGLTTWHSGPVGATVVAAPLLGPARSPMVNGQNAFQRLAGVGLTPTLSWSAPSVGTATDYRLGIDELSVTGGSTVARSLLVAYVHGTSFKVPAGVLAAGKTYAARLVARYRPWDTGSPERSGVPQGQSPCLLGPFSP